MRTRLAFGLHLPINVSPESRLTPCARTIRVQLLAQSRNRRLRLTAVLLAMLPAIGLSLLATLLTGHINLRRATQSSPSQASAALAASSSRTDPDSSDS